MFTGQALIEFCLLRGSTHILFLYLLCSFAMGIEFRESSYLIGPKTDATARKGMLFNVCVGFSNMTKSGSGGDSAAKTYALFLGDTATVKEDEPAAVCTQLKKRVKHVSVFLKVSVHSWVSVLYILG